MTGKITATTMTCPICGEKQTFYSDEITVGTDEEAKAQHIELLEEDIMHFNLKHSLHKRTMIETLVPCGEDGEIEDQIDPTILH